MALLLPSTPTTSSWGRERQRVRAVPWSGRISGLLACLCLCLGGVMAGCGKQETPSSEPPPKAVSSPIFIEVAEACGVKFTHQLADGHMSNIMESDGAGGTVLDYDGDGWMDIYLVNSGPHPVYSDAPPNTVRHPNRLLRNRGDGTFEDTTEKAGVAGEGFGTTAAAADYDNDGDTDLLAVNFGGCILYQNQGNGTFIDVTAKAGITLTNACISASFADVDLDGRLDLFVANYLTFDPRVKVPPGSAIPYAGPLSYPFEFNVLFRNRGDGTFKDISAASGVRIPEHRAMSVAPLDCDRDGDTDFYVSNDGTPNLLLVNDGKGRFSDAAALRGCAFNQFGEAAGSMGAAVGDCNSDALLDMLVTRFGQASLYLNAKGAFFEDQVAASGVLHLTSQYTGWGGNFLDFDNDGDLDIFIANGDPHYQKGMPPLLLENTGGAKLVNAASRGGPFFSGSINARGSAVLDVDNDGRLDVVVTTLGGRAHLLRQDGLASQNHWITLKLQGTRGNRDGFGAQVLLRASGREQYAECRCPTSYVFQQDPRLHFGLGAATQVEHIEIRWPGGQVQQLTNVTGDRVLLVAEPAPETPGS